MECTVQWVGLALEMHHTMTRACYISIIAMQQFSVKILTQTLCSNCHLNFTKHNVLPISTELHPWNANSSFCALRLWCACLNRSWGAAFPVCTVSCSFVHRTTPTFENSQLVWGKLPNCLLRFNKKLLFSCVIKFSCTLEVWYAIIPTIT